MRPAMYILALSISLMVVLPACENEPQRTPAPALGRTAVAADVVGVWITDPADIENAAHNQLLNSITRGEIDATESDIPRLIGPVVETLRRNPATFTFLEDATFTAQSHTMTVTGTWSLDADTLILQAPEHNMTRRFRVAEGRLENIASIQGGKPIALIRRTSP